MLNAYILFKKKRQKTFLQFEHHIMVDLVFWSDEPHADKVEAVARLTERHFPDKI